MDLGIKDKLFIVTGATSGLGNGCARALLTDGANIIAVARDVEKLDKFYNEYPKQITKLCGDISKSATINQLIELVGDKYLDGILVNAGGPPAKSFLETNLEDWDTAYKTILRWKVEITKAFLPKLISQQYGRVVYIESQSVKQPIENLVLSNSLRLAVVGFVKTLSQEIADKGITLNIMAPGFHDTAAAHRLYVKRSEVEGISIDQAKLRYESEIKVGRMGDVIEFGTLAAWLLSPISSYITGQTISVDGGAVKGTMG